MDGLGIFGGCAFAKGEDGVGLSLDGIERRLGVLYAPRWARMTVHCFSQ